MRRLFFLAIVSACLVGCEAHHDRKIDSVREVEIQNFDFSSFDCEQLVVEFLMSKNELGQALAGVNGTNAVHLAYGTYESRRNWEKQKARLKRAIKTARSLVLLSHEKGCPLPTDEE